MKETLTRRERVKRAKRIFKETGGGCDTHDAFNSGTPESIVVMFDTVYEESFKCGTVDLQ